MTESTQGSYRERMLRALLYLEKRLDEPLSLEELAGVAHFSPFHFHRVFRGMVGESVKSHIRRLRLERAANMLAMSDRPVTDIALDAGYEAHAAFTRAFGAVFGESPSSYRTAAKARLAAGMREAAPRSSETLLDRDKGGTDMDVSIEQFPKTKVVFARHVGPYAECGKAWGQVCAFAGPKGLFGPDTMFVGVCHDDPEVTPPSMVRYDACLTVTREVAPEGGIGVREIGGGEYATTVHKGPFDKLYATYAELFGVWGPQSGREFASAPSLEVYLNDPEKTPPEELLTKIYAQLEPK